MSDRAADERDRPFSYSLRRLLLRPCRHGTPCGEVELRAPDRVIQAPLQSALTQKGRGIVPERLGERITKIGTRDADIGEHSAIQPGQYVGLAPVTARASKLFEPVGHQGQQRSQSSYQSAAGHRQNNIFSAHISLHSVRGLQCQNQLWHRPEPPEIPTRFLWKPKNIALRGLIS